MSRRDHVTEVMVSEVDQRNVEMLQEEFERQRANVGEMQRRLGGISATAVSPRREVSVSVGNQGELTEIKFPSSAHRRLPAKELAELITRTYREAREKVMNQVVDAMSPALPGIDAKALLSGKLPADALPMPELPPLIEELRGAANLPGGDRS
ncbi:YbaB/EbfC family nucleoid-associated protein [Saccharopolyspora sp. NPDC000359]|uniref:YbaB/EbfC family nucleoid-associated protein n=1 Tax=Saccharopolyspora sp. NPDC000359 TaxID=3154251 RepID=UPI00332EABF8